MQILLKSLTIINFTINQEKSLQEKFDMKICRIYNHSKIKDRGKDENTFYKHP